MEDAHSSAAVSYHIQASPMPLRSRFPYFAHHDSVSALWSQKWRELSIHGIYPFGDGKVADFDPIFAKLIKTSGDDPAILNRPDDYAAPFLPVGERLNGQAEDALSQGHYEEAKALFLRAAAVYRIARFPINRSPLTQEAWVKGKAAYEKGGELLVPPSVSVDLPFGYADVAAGDRDAAIPAYLRLPIGSKPVQGWPVVLFVCGLDAYRTDHTVRTQEHVDRGYATLSFEIPGTGDCPAAPNDPAAPDRLINSILDWVAVNAVQYELDPTKVIVRGVSTGGYYAFRVAHTHANRLLAVVAQGGGAHHMFDSAWIRAQDQMEYPYALAEALAFKFGYRDADTAVALDRYAEEASKFSLRESGVIDMPSCKLLAINGMEDSIFPIEDSYLVTNTGGPKDLIVRGERGHMGNPGAEEILYRWIDNAVAGQP